MRQGRASPDGPAGKKREPIAHVVSVKAVSQIGSSMGNHATGQSGTLDGTRQLYQGRGFEAPHDAGRQVHRGGSQGRR